MIPDWFVDGLTAAAVTITAIFLFAIAYTSLLASPTRKGKYHGFVVRHRSGINLYESPVKPQASQPSVRCLYGHDVSPTEAEWTPDHGWVCVQHNQQGAA